MKTHYSFVTLATCILLAFSACEKDNEDYLSSSTSNSNFTTQQQVGYINIINNTPTAITFTLNGSNATKTLSMGASISISGEAGQAARLSIVTICNDDAGNPVGLKLTMHESFKFPAAGKTVQEPINIPSDVFLLYAVNETSSSVNHLVINNGLATEMNTRIAIPGNREKIQCGYYPAPEGSTNIKAMQQKTGGAEWDFSNLTLTNKENQSITINIHSL
jgi:hypothetical protein